MLRRYPDASKLEQKLADRLGCAPECVLVTAGADEAIDRVCRAWLGPDREMLLPVPSFEMIPRYAALAGATVRTVPWSEGALPVEAMCRQISALTAVIVVVSPNNPTGAVATAKDLERLSRAAPHAILLVDLVYTEFAEIDLTTAALALPNTVVCRSLSKAHGLASLRIGYALADPGLIGILRSAGGPYPVAGPSLALATEALADGEGVLRDYVARVRVERRRIRSCVEELGLRARPSQGNFVLIEAASSTWIRDGLASLGIGIRIFPEQAGLQNALRITCPGDEASMLRLEAGLATVLRPEALLFDMDGVLADVSASYDRAILETAARFGVQIATVDIAAAKARGHANDDWLLTQGLIRLRGVDVDLTQVKDCFEELYQGTDQQPGFWRSEGLLPPRLLLERLAGRLPLAIVTGRPRADMDRFVEDQGLADIFCVKVCREDAPQKPDPAPLQLALERLGVQRAWMIGDTPDDLVAARAAGVVGIGIVAPGEERSTTTTSLLHAGAARVLTDLCELEEILQ